MMTNDDYRHRNIVEQCESEFDAGRAAGEKLGYDRAIKEVVEWLRRGDGIGVTSVLADCLENGSWKRKSLTTGTK